jgi:thioredoxin-dependent peroxiredoxin
LFAELGAIVLGISFDTPAANKRFADKQRFAFSLLSDIDHTVGETYGVLRPAGHRWSAVPRRITFLIDPDRVVRRVYDVADVAHHADDVLADLRDLAGD